MNKVNINMTKSDNYFNNCMNSTLMMMSQLDIERMQQEQQKSQYIWQLIQIIFYSLTFFIGTIGNVLVIFVILMNTKLKTVTNMYLLHLAITDVIYLQCIPFAIVTLIKQQWIFNIIICKIFWTFTGINQFTSIFILAVLAFDRYLAVCQPVLAINWRKVASSRIILFVVWLISFLFMMPVILYSDVDQFQLMDVDNNSNNNSVLNGSINQHVFPKPTCTIKWPENTFIKAEVTYVTYGIIISFLLPVTFILILYVLVVKKLQEIQRKLNHQSNERDTARRKVTILVLSVIGVSLVVYTPFWINQIVLITYYSFLKEPSELVFNVTMHLSTIFQILLYVNSALNPYLYAFLSKIFRESFKKVFQFKKNYQRDYLIIEAVNERNLVNVQSIENINLIKLTSEYLNINETK